MVNFESTGTYQVTARRRNLATVLRSIVDGGPRSRARLAEDNHLTKATVSSLVGELEDRGFVVVGESSGHGPGRPGQVVRLNTESVRCLGIEINVDYIAGVALDLTGQVRARARRPLPLAKVGFERGLRLAAEVAEGLVRAGGSSPRQVHSIHLSIPGLVDAAAGVLTHAPNLGWSDVDMVRRFGRELRWKSVRIAIENDANLGAIAEYAARRPAGVRELLYVVGEVGVGGGSVVDGKIVQGAHGLSAEVGHMPIGPQSRVCGCGRRGCWETVVGLAALLNDVAAPPDPIHDPTIDLGTRLVDIRDRALAGDRRVIRALTRHARWLGIGLSVIISVVDPAIIVLGGHFVPLQGFLVRPMMAEISARTIAYPVCQPVIEFSSLGFEAACLGAAQAGLEELIADPGSVEIALAG